MSARTNDRTNAPRQGPLPVFVQHTAPYRDVRSFGPGPCSIKETSDV